MRTKVSLVVAAMLLLEGCNANIDSRSQTSAKTDRLVTVRASIDDFIPNYPVVYKGTSNDMQPDNMSGIAAAAVIRVEKSSAQGPQRIIIFFLSDSKEIEVVRKKGAHVSFQIEDTDFRKAAHEKDVLQEEPFVFSGALLNLKADGEDSNQ